MLDLEPLHLQTHIRIGAQNRVVGAEAAVQALVLHAGKVLAELGVHGLVVLRSVLQKFSDYQLILDYYREVSCLRYPWS